MMMAKKKHTGNPFIKNMHFKVKVLSHERDSKVLIFKQKRRKGYQKKNGYRGNFTLIQIDKLSLVTPKKTAKVAKKPVIKKSTTPTKKKKSTTKLTKK